MALPKFTWFECARGFCLTPFSPEMGAKEGLAKEWFFTERVTSR